MKVSTLLISLILSLSNAAWAGPSDAEHKPMHGGVLVTVKDIDYELVANPQEHGATRAIAQEKTPTQTSWGSCIGGAVSRTKQLLSFKE